MQSQTTIFTRLVKDVMHKPKVCVASDTPLAKVVELIAERDANSCIAVDKSGKIIGILRLKDIVSKITFQIESDVLLEEVMDTNIQTVKPYGFLFQAIARMRRLCVPEIVVVDDQNHPIGLMHLPNAYEAASSSLIEKIDRLASDGDVENLKTVKSAQIEMAADLRSEHVPPYEVQNLLSHINKDICAKIIENHTRNMAQEGWGEAPVEFAVIIMGSGGRSENFLNPDQDNGFILEDYPDEDHRRVDLYFRELATRFCDDLNHIGFDYCNGNVMATNPLWRKSLSQWKDQIHLWGRKRNHVALRLADIFFDFDHVCGQKWLSNELRTSVMETVSKNHFFLQEMFHQQSEHRVALGRFGMLETQKGMGPYKGFMNMKYHALLPLIEATRLLALKNQIVKTSTRARLEALSKKGLITDTQYDHLINAHRIFSDILLKSQIEEATQGRPLSPYINPKALTKREKDRLVYSLKQVDRLQKNMKSEFTGDVF